MKKITTSLLAGIMLTSTITVFAASGRTIEVFDNVKRVVVNKVDKPFDKKDKPFVYNGTTYVPLRFVAHALGESVDWDGKTGTVYIGETENPSEAHFGTDINHSLWDFENKKTNTTNYSYKHNAKGYSVSDILGNKYTSYITMETMGYDTKYGRLTFPLNGQYNTFSAILGVTNRHQYVSSNIFKIEVDGREIYNKTANAGDLLTPIKLDVTGANNITFILEGGNGDKYAPMELGLFNPCVY